MTLVPITTLDALQGLEPQWLDLWHRDPLATPFQAPQWLLPWWRHVGQGELLSLAIREADELVALVPLYVYTQDSGSRDLFPLGIATTDYLDGLFAPGRGKPACAMTMQYLDSQAHRWDVADLPQLRDSSPLLAGPTPEGWREQISESEPCPVLTLPGRIEDLSTALPENLPQNLRYYRHRAQKLGATVESADQGNWEEFYDALLQLHRARWEARQETGVLADPRVQHAHRETIPGLLQIGALRMYGLRLDGHLIAVLYALADVHAQHRRVYYYLGGFDPAMKGISPGNLLIGYAVEEAIRDHVEAFDFLRGRESYKYYWGAQDSLLHRRRLWHSPVRQQAAASAAAAQGGAA